MLLQCFPTSLSVMYHTFWWIWVVIHIGIFIFLIFDDDKKHIALKCLSSTVIVVMLWLFLSYICHRHKTNFLNKNNWITTCNALQDKCEGLQSDSWYVKQDKCLWMFNVLLLNFRLFYFLSNFSLICAFFILWNTGSSLLFSPKITLRLKWDNQWGQTYG